MLAIKEEMSAEALVSKIQDLPSLPDVVMRVYQMADDPQMNAQKIGAMIYKDQALTARALRMVNSAYFGLSRRIASIEEAVIVLGAQAIKNLALLAATYPLMQKTLNGYTEDKDGLWKHALATGLIAQLCAKQIELKNPSELFTAGLLHDVGKLILSTSMSEWMGDLREMVTKRGKSVVEAEQELFGFTHADVGAALVDRWNLPNPIADLVLHHHNAAQTGNPENAIVQFADYCANTLGYPLSQEVTALELDPALLAIIDFSDGSLKEFMQKAQTALQGAQAMF